MTESRDDAWLRRLFDGILGGALAVPLSVTACSTQEGTAPRELDAGREAATRDACAPVLRTTVITKFDDGGMECRAYQEWSCGVPSGIESVDGGCDFSVADCQSLCPSYGAYHCRAAAESCTTGTVGPGAVTVQCDFCPGALGRRPRGMPAAHRSTPSGVPQRHGGSRARATIATPATKSALAAYFEHAAELEGASVYAFAELLQELGALGAPSGILRATARAIADERRHERLSRALARRFGGRPRRARVPARPRAPSLSELALENVVEGCVRETHAALVAAAQARHARDPAVAAVLRTIARDERRHAALSFRIARWAAPRLDAAAARRIEDAVREAVAQLREAVRAPHPEVARSAGVPGAAEQRRYVDALAALVWNQAALQPSQSV